MSTQVERTEQVISGQPEPQIHIHAHARALARKLDAVLDAVAKEEGGNNHEFHPCNLVCREIRAIIEEPTS